MDIAISIFAGIGMVIVAWIIASLLTPFLLYLLDTLIRTLVRILSATPLAKHIAEVISKSPPRPNHDTYNRKGRIYIPKPIQNYIYFIISKSILWQAKIIKHLDASDEKPLIKDIPDIVSKPVTNKGNHPEGNLSRGKKGVKKTTREVKHVHCNKAQADKVNTGGDRECVSTDPLG